MSTITFRGSFIRYADLRKQEEAGVFARLHFTAALSAPVMKALGWESIPLCVDQTKLSGLLTARTMILTPNQKELRQHELQIECTEVSDFQLFRVKEDDGDGGKSIKREELRFIARVREAGAIALAESYMRIVGEGEGALKVTYTDQQNLDLGDDDKQATLTDDQEPDDDATLAPAAGMGGTHQRGKQRREPLQ